MDNTTATCPCCYGARVLLVLDESKPDVPPIEHDCTHCDRKGFVRLDARASDGGK